MYLCGTIHMVRKIRRMYASGKHFGSGHPEQQGWDFLDWLLAWATIFGGAFYPTTRAAIVAT